MMEGDRTLTLFFTALTPNDLLRVMLGLILISMVLRGLLLGRLHGRHNDVWIALGKPTLFGNGKDTADLLRFTGLRGDFRKLQDPAVNLLAYMQRASIILIILVFVGAILLGLTGHK